MSRSVKCRLCGDQVDPESPYATRTLNPQTFRPSWMHTLCYEVAYDLLAEKAARNIKFDSRQDEYLAAIQEWSG